MHAGIGIIGAVILCTLGYLLYVRLSVPDVPAIPENQQSSSEDIIQPGFEAVSTESDGGTISDAPRAAPSGMREYRNTAYRISLFYPDDLSVKNYDEGKGAATITFQNPATAKGFQVFIVPYDLKKISRERFAQDVPSGVIQGVMKVTVGGVSATSFYSSNAILGETAEIWFIRGGYLYEFTAPKSDAVWFSEIMNTLNFI